MNSLFIENAVLDGRKVNALITDGVFAKIAPDAEAPRGVTSLDAGGMILAPAFYNAHTHSAMSVMRSMADDIRLEKWLSEHIWPYEAGLTPDIVRRGVRLAIEEMIRSGTVFFNDMYWFPDVTLEVAAEMGVRAVIGSCLISNPLASFTRLEELEAAYAGLRDKSLVSIAYAPHAVYSTSESMLRDTARQAAADGRFIHIHASETRKEVEDCVAAHGMTPIAWLEKCGVLGPRTILAHCVHLTEDDIRIIRESGAVAVHNPCSNYKLCSGQFDFRGVYEEGRCRVALGTDGCASNNSLSFFDEMKLAALNAKIRSGDPECGKADDILSIATRGGAEAFGLHAGVIAEGWLGDAILLDPSAPQLNPPGHLAANLVYAADTSCVDTVICAGRILMRGRRLL
jgi:5-methylthioadenosine/S-adenosylhomocysteine deaminase